MATNRHGHRILGFIAHNRVTIGVAVAVSLTSSATAVAASYLVLGTTNTAAATTTLRSGVNGAVLQLTNSNPGGGSNARGLQITVPSGHAPVTVNATAGKATNLNADKLDGIDSSWFVQGARAGAFWEKSKGRTFLNRIDTIKGDPEVKILEVPHLLQIAASCGSFGADTQWSIDVISEVNGLQIFYDGLGYPASYTTLNASDGLVLSAHDIGRLTIQAGIGADARTGQRLVTINMFGMPAGGTCFHQFSALSQAQ
jgi:hypothetical protein